MDSYTTSLLSPIDNFAFTQFVNSPAGNNPAPRGKTNSHNIQQQQQDVLRTPLPNPNNEWQELLDSSQAGHFSFNMWDDNPFGQDKQSSGSPWRPQVFRTLSDSFLDSPLSSSSFLSSASGSPSVLSSTTCSPWQTCPGLAPVSPNIPLLDELSLGLQGSLSVSSDDVSAYGFNNLSLGSPIQLSHEVDNGAIEPFSLMEPQPHVAAATTVEPSHLMSNALGLEIGAQDHGSSTRMTSDDATQMFAPFGQPVTSPPQSKGSSPLSDPGDVPSVPPHSVPSHTASSSSFEPFPSASSAPSDSALYNRASRRRASHVDYAEAAYDGDSDEELEESSGSGANLMRIAKRRKAVSESPTFTYSESDEDAELSEFGTRRGKKGGRRTVAKGNSNAKRKSKRRHHCPLEGCNQTFTRVTDMARHLGSVHRTVDTDANRCSFCHKAFSRDDAVLRHENDSCPMRPRKNNNRNEVWV